MADTQAQSVLRRQVAPVVAGEVAQRTCVRVVFDHDGIQIVVGHAAAGAAAQGVFAPDVLSLRKGTGGGEAAAGEHGFPVESGLRILECVDLDHPAHFSTVFGRNPGGVNAHRLNIVRFNFRTKARRTVVRQRNPIDHNLCLVFRTARMEHGIAFIKPAGLRIYQVLKGAAGD